MRPERLFAFLFVTGLLAGCASQPQPKHLVDNASTDQADAARVHTELAEHYIQQGRLKDALDKLQIALQFDPDYVPAHTVLGVLYERIGEVAKAEEQKRIAVQLNPKDGATNNNYAVFLCQQGKIDQAMPYFQRAVADPFYATPSAAWSNAGSCLLKGGRFDQAQADYRKALKIDPKNSEALLQMASLLYRQNKAFDARAFIQRFESVAKPTAYSLQLGYNIESSLGNAEGAQDYARRLRKQFPDSEQAHALDATSGS